MATTQSMLLLLVSLLVTRSSSSLNHYKREGHSIMKRMAERGHGFERHDVARVHLVGGQGQSSRRLVKRDLRDAMYQGLGSETMKTLQLALSSGSHVNLTLTQANIADHTTVVSYVKDGRKTEKKLARLDCYSYGQVDDSSGKGLTAVSHCDGVFGFAHSRGFEYFLHPVESRRFKRDTSESYDVHVMWRRSTPDAQQNLGELVDYLYPEEDDADDDDNSDDSDDGDASKRTRRDTDAEGDARDLVVEIGMFSDARYCEMIDHLYPERQDDFLLTKLAGVQALFRKREGITYEIHIKVKHIEYWETNPEDYTFIQDLGKNLRSFCSYANKKHPYDILALNSGVTKFGVIGMAYIGGACTGSRCLAVKGTDLDSFRGYAHELGHNLGMSHYNSCPRDLKKVGGFMGGPSPYNFSPCMKHHLDKFLANGKGRSNCLYKETKVPETKVEFNDLPDEIFPGQKKSADGLCQLLAGTDFRYVTNERPVGSYACRWFMCLNDNQDSDDFRRARFFTAPIGFPCKEESFCHIDTSCYFWNQSKNALDTEALRKVAEMPEWSEWSSEFTQCSRSCGTGVRTRHRVCEYSGPNVTPYCPGLSLKPELCNANPCPGILKEGFELRQDLGDQLCAGFLEKGVSLRLKKATAYLPTSSYVTIDDATKRLNVFRSQSCLLKCDREPLDARGDLDAVMPDGTPCSERDREWYTLNRLNIELRCIGGHCLETSDCPGNILEAKDDCGICGGDDSRCVKLFFGADYIVPRRYRSTLAVIPQGATNINVYAENKINTGVVLELWSMEDENILGDGGQNERGRYDESNAVEYAGTRWMSDPSMAYLRAAGPINQPITIKYRRLATAMKRIIINYAKAP